MYSDECNEIISKQFTKFVVAVVRNGRKDYIRKTNDVIQREILVPDMSEYLSPDDDAGINIQQYADYHKLENYLSDPALHQAVASLTDRQKHVLYLSIVLDMECTRIASFLHCSPRNIRNVKKTALKKIITSWEASEYEL